MCNPLRCGVAVPGNFAPIFSSTSRIWGTLLSNRWTILWALLCAKHYEWRMKKDGILIVHSLCKASKISMRWNRGTNHVLRIGQDNYSVLLRAFIARYIVNTNALLVSFSLRPVVYFKSSQDGYLFRSNRSSFAEIPGYAMSYWFLNRKLHVVSCFFHLHSEHQKASIDKLMPTTKLGHVGWWRDHCLQTRGPFYIICTTAHQAIRIIYKR